MNNRPSMPRVIVLGAALAFGCSPTPNILPTNDFNRPTDMAFMCLGAFGTEMPDGDGGMVETGPFQVSGRPMKACHNPPMKEVKQPLIAPSVHNRTFAFVPSSADGSTIVRSHEPRFAVISRQPSVVDEICSGSEPTGTRP